MIFKILNASQKTFKTEKFGNFSIFDTPPQVKQASADTGHIATIAYGTRLGFVGNDILTLIVKFDDSNVKTGCDG